jgi:hypothetical protein
MNFILFKPSLLENRTYIPGSDFDLYRVFLTPVQISTFVPVGGNNRYKYPLTGSRRRHLPPTQYKWHTFVPGGGYDRYKCEANTFVPVLVVARCRCDRCATTIFPSSPPPPRPSPLPTLLLPLSNSSSPSPMAP